MLNCKEGVSMEPQEFIKLGGQIEIFWTKFGYDVVATFNNQSLERRYVGHSFRHKTQKTAMQKAVKECMVSRKKHLRAEQRNYISKGWDISLITDAFTGHPGIIE
jgi:hypothetical protein